MLAPQAPVANLGMAAPAPAPRPAADRTQQAAQLGHLAGLPKSITDADLASALQSMSPAERAAFASAFKASMSDAMAGFQRTGQIQDAGFMDKVNRRIMIALGPKDGAQFEASLHLDNLQGVTGQKLAPSDRRKLVGIAIGHPDKMARLHRFVAKKAA